MDRARVAFQHVHDRRPRLVQVMSLSGCAAPPARCFWQHCLSARSQSPPAPARFACAGMRVWGVGCRVQGSGFRVQGSGLRVQGSGSRVQGSGFRVQGAGFRVQGSGTPVILHGVVSPDVWGLWCTGLALGVWGLMIASSTEAKREKVGARRARASSAAAENPTATSAFGEIVNYYGTS